MAVATLVIFLALFSPTSFSVPEGCGDCMTQPNTLRKEENVYDLNGISKRDRAETSLEDYRLIDPAPSSKAAIKPAPIQHGGPFGPYIPQPTPPSHPKKGP